MSNKAFYNPIFGILKRKVKDLDGSLNQEKMTRFGAPVTQLCRHFCMRKAGPPWVQWRVNTHPDYCRIMDWYASSL